MLRFFDYYYSKLVVWKACDCVHAKVPDGKCQCKWFGTKDGAKAPCLRFSTLINCAEKFCKDNRLKYNKSINSSTVTGSTRCYHVSYLSNLYQLDPHTRDELLTRTSDKVGDGIVIRHLCGCGSGAKGGCCIREHLKLGLQSKNRDDTHWHFVRDKLSSSGADYSTFKKLYYNKAESGHDLIL